MGTVEEVGDGVISISQGDRVVMPFNVACGFCKNCVAGYTGFCRTVNRSASPVGPTVTSRWGHIPAGRPSTCGGQCNVKRYNRQLRDMIIAGRATPSFVVSHEEPLDRAPDAYQKFDKRIEGYTKVVLHPEAA